MTFFSRFFKKKKSSDGEVKISFYRLDPKSRKLVIYYTMEAPPRSFTIEIKDKEGQKFPVTIPSLKAHEGYILPFEEISNSPEKKFNGEIVRITAFTRNGEETFVLSKNKFRRVRRHL